MSHGRRRRTRPEVHAIVADIDGTITDGKRRLYPPAVAALLREDRRGVPVIFATGNVLPVALALHRFNGFSGPIIAENGGLLYERVDGHDRVKRLARLAPARRAFRALVRAGLRPVPLFTNRWRETEIGLEPNLPVAKARRVLRGFGVDVVPTGFAIHLIEAGKGKLPALRRALARYRLAPGDCLIAGDGDNDLEMLEAAGFAVSFPTGSVRARSVADYVTSKPYGFGFVEALKRARILGASPTG
ncbi:MAG: HAD hydrolase family protein [Thermoplasmata archaeon]|nr:HAD hydrolase family protein [Thermoplasmata archaeon]